MVQGTTKYPRLLPGSLSPACSESRCQTSLLVLHDPSPGSSNHIVVLVPTTGSVTVATISLDSMAVTGHHTIPLPSCDPVLITGSQPNTTLAHVMCVKQGAVHLYIVTINTTMLSLSSATGPVTHRAITSLSCLSNMITSRTPQGTLIVFADCRHIVTLSLTQQIFYSHDPNTCGGNIQHIAALNGHPSTILVYCNTTSPIYYYDIDNEGPSNMTTAPPTKIPTPCADPLAMVKAIPASGDIEYQSYTGDSCTDQLSVTNDQLLSWQCLGNHVDLIIPYTTHSGLHAVMVNLTQPCAPHSNITMIHDIDCSNQQCRPLTSITDRYLVFQSRNGNLYDIIIYCVAPIIKPLATIGNADSLILLTVVHGPPSPSPPPSSSPSPSLTSTPSPIPSTSPVLLAVIISLPVIAAAAAIIIAVILLTVFIIKRNAPQRSEEEKGPSHPSRTVQVGLAGIPSAR